VFQTLVSESQTSSPVFAFKLAAIGDQGSELSIGGLDSSVYSGTPTYVDILVEGFWEIKFTSLTTNRTPVVGASPAILEPVRLLLFLHFPS
jgi:cathepsin D